MDWRKEREIVAKYKFDIFSGTYNLLRQVMKVLDELEPKATIKNKELYDEFYELKEYEKFVMKQYLNTNK